MNPTGLTDAQWELIREVLRPRTEVRAAILFGSRAKGSHRPESDVDLALVGVTDDLQAEVIAEALESLPLPFRFDVKAFERIRHAPLLAHIQRVGLVIYQRDESE